MKSRGGFFPEPCADRRRATHMREAGMAYDIPGGIGVTGYSDTDDILKRLDRLRESGPTWDDFKGRAADGAGRTASLEEVRDLLGPESGGQRPTASTAALAEIRDLLTDVPVLLEESALKSVVLQESGRLIRAE
jgi:hypothetical protein